jgi:hypothetical protein
VAGEAEPPEHHENRHSQNRVKGFGELDKQRPSFQPCSFRLESQTEVVNSPPIASRSHRKPT